MAGYFAASLFQIPNPTCLIHFIPMKNAGQVIKSMNASMQGFHPDSDQAFNQRNAVRAA